MRLSRDIAELGNSRCIDDFSGIYPLDGLSDAGTLSSTLLEFRNTFDDGKGFSTTLRQTGSNKHGQLDFRDFAPIPTCGAIKMWLYNLRSILTPLNHIISGFGVVGTYKFTPDPESQNGTVPRPFDCINISEYVQTPSWECLVERAGDLDNRNKTNASSSTH